MRLLASDYDGTLASHGVIQPEALAAVRRWKAANGLFAIVTGRKLEDLFAWFPHRDVLDAVAAEDGAVVWNAATGRVRTLAAAPPPLFLEELRRRRVPFDAGRVTLYTCRPHDRAVLETARDMGLAHHVIFNYDAVMVLPMGIDKAAGVSAIAKSLDLPMSEVAGIGDAENDLPLLLACGRSGAVANAIPSIKAAAHVVTKGERGAGFDEFVRHLMGA